MQLKEVVRYLLGMYSMKIFSLKHYVYARVAGFSNKVTRHHERLRVAFDLQNADFEFNYLTGPVSYAGSY